MIEFGKYLEPTSCSYENLTKNILASRERLIVERDGAGTGALAFFQATFREGSEHQRSETEWEVPGKMFLPQSII